MIYCAHARPWSNLLAIDLNPAADRDRGAGPAGAEGDPSVPPGTPAFTLRTPAQTDHEASAREAQAGDGSHRCDASSTAPGRSLIRVPGPSALGVPCSRLRRRRRIRRRLSWVSQNQPQQVTDSGRPWATPEVCWCGESQQGNNHGHFFG